MFLGYQKDKIMLAADDKAALEKSYMRFDRIEETADSYVLYQGEYILQAHAQAKQAAAQKKARLQTLQQQLDSLDLKTIRALRAMSAGTGAQADKEQLEQLEAQAAGLRAQLRELAA